MSRKSNNSKKLNFLVKLNFLTVWVYFTSRNLVRIIIPFFGG